MSIPKNAKASILLLLDPNSPIGSIAKHFMHKIVFEDGREVLHFWSTGYDPTGPYLAVTAIEPDTDQEARYLVPHGMVAMILDLPIDQTVVTKMGFV